MNPTVIQVTNADLAALIQAATATLERIDALAEKLSVAVDAIQKDVNDVSGAITTAIPEIQADVKEATTAVKAFKFSFSGPLGMHGGSS
jgi:hypothetical protein